MISWFHTRSPYSGWKRASINNQRPQILDSSCQLPPCPRALHEVKQPKPMFGPNGVKSRSVTGGGWCTFACLAVSMKYANDISKEALWEHFSWHFSKYTWLPEVLTVWLFPFLRRQFCSCWSADSLWKMRPERVPCSLSLLWLHFSRSQVSGTCKWKARWGSTWLISDLCSVPPHTLTVKLPPILLGPRGRHPGASRGPFNMVAMACVCPQPVTCNQPGDFDRVPQGDLVVSGQSERNWCCTKMYVNTYIIYMGISECYCCLSTNPGPGIGLGGSESSCFSCFSPPPPCSWIIKNLNYLPCTKFICWGK